MSETREARIARRRLDPAWELATEEEMATALTGTGEEAAARLIDSAAQAVELFGDDALEAFADARRAGSAVQDD